MSDENTPAAATARDVAEYMVTLIPPGHGRLTQTRASGMIRKNFGFDYVVKNKNNNWGIRPDVLKEFNALTTAEPYDMVWMMSQQTWRRRQPTDAAGRLAKRKKG